jgi:hypothetical protein
MHQALRVGPAALESEANEGRTARRPDAFLMYPWPLGEFDNVMDVALAHGRKGQDGGKCVA